ncbi:ribosomal protein RPL27 [Toxoplasma gondii GAB2-2007-GAL-DOM2]|uniref:Ribosomal protein RPL27 n=2 Tax=Toxoplasma gondii TaxID=5811 RepID=A0A086KRV6_TOXGO|nr:ribosomal protein RPL27 [Toxoplasma gondii GAB2-2007-GAL-DOM2]KFG47124.1 ribosomal protein RPL27 [Toxoplasma gondii FOU]
MGRSSLAFVASACFLLCVSVPVSRLGVASVIVGQPDTAQHSRQFAFGFCGPRKHGSLACSESRHTIVERMSVPSLFPLKSASLRERSEGVQRRPLNLSWLYPTASRFGIPSRTTAPCGGTRPTLCRACPSPSVSDCGSRSLASPKFVHGLGPQDRGRSGSHSLLFSPHKLGRNDVWSYTRETADLSPGGRTTFLWATKKGGGSTKNGRDSQPKFLGVKKFGGEFVLPGHILVRQRGTRYKAGDGVRLCRDDSLTAVRSGYVDFLPVYKFEYHFRKRRWLKRHRRRVHAGFLVSVLDSMEESRGHQKRQELVLLRTLASSWVNGHTFSPAVPSLEEERVRIDEQGSDFSEFSVHESMQGQRRAAADGTEGLLADSVESENRGVNALDKGLLLGATHV